MATAASPDLEIERGPVDTIVVTGQLLRHDEAVEAVADDTCGATATFLGTTRSSHAGRNVLRLAYEAHESMALRVIREIVAEARVRSGGRLSRIYVAHRVGEVPVGGCSVSGHEPWSPGEFTSLTSRASPGAS